MDKLDRSMRKLERLADSSISLDDIALPEILDQTLTALAANQLPSKGNQDHGNGWSSRSCQFRS